MDSPLASFFSVIFVTLLMACVYKHPRGREEIEVESLFAWKTIS